MTDIGQNRRRSLGRYAFFDPAMMIRKLTLLLFLTFSTTSVVVAQSLKDPRTRDEDFSDTAITVTHRILPDGMHEYFYDIDSPVTNHGKISSFFLDVSCGRSFSNVDFSESPIRSFRNDSGDGMHVPMQAYGVMYFTDLIGITRDNYLMWGVGIKPGQKAIGYRVISPVGPGNLDYILTPVMDAEGWDYLSYEEGDPTVPWISDFTVSGMIAGPACPNNNDNFSGTNKNRQEPKIINSLLSYSSLLKDRFHVDKDTKEIELTIHYSKDIDPKSFKVEPDTIKHLFEPKPGTSQTVTLPLSKSGEDTNKIKFRFEARMTEKAMGENKIKSDKAIDKDEFEIRIDG